ncbi:hypothetical protein MHYP_G00037460 [Metynnis hypsauchen]
MLQLCLKRSAHEGSKSSSSSDKRPMRLHKHHSPAQLSTHTQIYTTTHARTHARGSSRGSVSPSSLQVGCSECTCCYCCRLISGGEALSRTGGREKSTGARASEGRDSTDVQHEGQVKSGHGLRGRREEPPKARRCGLGFKDVRAEPALLEMRVRSVRFRFS